MFFRRRESAARARLAMKDLLGGRALLGRHHAGEAMDRAAADRGDVVERLLEQRFEFRSRPGTAASPNSPLPRRPVLIPSMVRPCRSISAFTARRRDVVGKMRLDRVEAGRRGRAEALQQRAVGEHDSRDWRRNGAWYVPLIGSLRGQARVFISAPVSSSRHSREKTMRSPTTLSISP